MNETEAAFALLKQIFAEEDFATSPERMRKHLESALPEDAGAVFLAWQKEKAVGVVVTPEAQAAHDRHGFYQKHGFKSARAHLI